jgi:energy-coupling factor transport system ATP-binding protein
MIRFESVTITYPDAERPALRDVDLSIPEGELVLVIGRTGAGKSTLLKAVNGLVPHFTGGTLTDRIHSPDSSPTLSRKNSRTRWSRSA